MQFAKSSLVLLLLLAGLTGCNTGATPAPLVIGHISDKTRPDKAGNQAELGIRLALNHLDNEALAKEFGGRALQVRHTDTRGQLDAFEAQAVRLDSLNRSLALMGGLSPAETMALNHAKIPLLTLHGQPTSGASNLVFYLGMSPARQGAVLAKIVADDVKTMRIVILADEKRTEASASADSFEKTFTELRKHAKVPPATITILRFGEVPATLPRPPDDNRWRELNKRIVALEPDTVVFAGQVKDFNAWQNTLRKDHPKANPQLVYAGADGDHRLFDLEGNDKVSVTLATAFYADPTSEKITAFMKAYQEAFQIEADVHAAVAYDGFRMLVEAMKQAGTQLTPDQVREKLLTIKDFEGLTGPLTVTPDRQVRRTLYGVRWQGGALQVIRAFPADKDSP